MKLRHCVGIPNEVVLKSVPLALTICVDETLIMTVGRGLTLLASIKAVDSYIYYN
jgi:hypothetical protein